MSPQVQSALISGFIALIVLIANYNMNKRSEKVQREIANRNIDANLVANARIEWIQETRKISADIISTTSRIQRNINTYMGQKENAERALSYNAFSNYNKFSKEAEQTHSSYQDDLDTLFFKVNLFRLNLGKNDVNDEFVAQALTLLDTFILETHLIQEYINGESPIDTSFSLVRKASMSLPDNLNEYINLSRTYYKEEWTKAKQGK